MSPVRNIAFLGTMLAVIIVFSWFEFVISSLLLLPPHMKLGLANIVTMYCVIFVSKKSGFTLNMLKSLFVLLTRGPIAGLLSFSGGMLSIGIIVLLIMVFGNKISYIALSVAGALLHNLGQFGAMIMLLGELVLIGYLPVMIISGIIAGVLTGILLKVTLPIFGYIDFQR